MLAGNDAKAEEWRAAVGADLVATSLTHARDVCVTEARAHAKHSTVGDIPSRSELERNLRVDSTL